MGNFINEETLLQFIQSDILPFYRFAPALQDFYGFDERSWFQQDGTICQTSNDSLNAARENSCQKVISRGGDINWLPRCPDLSPEDFFLAIP